MDGHLRPGPPWRRPRRRALLVACASVVLVLAGLAPAQARPAAPVPFTNGTASATAIVTRLAPGVGSLPTGLFAGVALTNVTNHIAQAQAQTLDLGLIGDLLAALAMVPPEDLPSATQVDNRTGNASASKDDDPIAGSTLGGGRNSVQATTTPSAHAASTLVSGFGDVVKVQGGRAESTSEVIPGTARQARASVSVDVDIAGIVTLSGLRWEAFHRSGAGATSTGSFGITSAAIGGVPLPLDSLSAAESAINAALTPVGISVQLPKVEHATTPTDLVRVTPLQILLKDSPAGKTALGPILSLSRAQRTQLFDQLNAAYAPLGAALLAADVVTTILSGSGFLDLEVGGTEATSGTVPVATPAGSPAKGSGGLGPAISPLAPLPATGATAAGPPAGPDVGGGGPGVDLTDACHSLHAHHPNRCWDGALLPIGLIGLVGAAAMAAVDLRHQRRRRGAASTGGVAVVVRASGGRRLLRSYGPLGAVAMAFVLLATAVGVPRTHVAYRGPLQVPSVNRTPALDANGAPVVGPLDSVTAGRTPTVPAGAGATAVGGCPDRARQVPGDPYSPPCYAFRGGNGGATSKGVTGDTINVSVRDVQDGSATDIFASLGGESIGKSTASTQQTLDALAQYFSDRFQFYGRRLKIEYYRGQGNGITELLGGGQEQASADAVQAAKELHAFADVSGITIPYSDALSRDGVVNFGAPYPSRKWYEDRQPYAWSLFPDGSNVVAATSSAIIGRYPPGSLAEHAGPGLRGKPRTFAIIAPENAEYQESINVLLARLHDAHIPVLANEKYKLDLVSFPNQASNIIAQLKDSGVTSVLCLCDPAMLAFGLAPKANEQDYQPEWVTAGLVFVDQDVVAQTVDSAQWSHAFGTAYNAVSEPIGNSFPYFAYKSVRPNDEPIPGVEELYYQMYLLAIGIQMAGPNLTPQSFQAGMFAYPPAFGPRGTWDFGPGDHTPTNDYREIWWDPKRISLQDGRPGAWAQLNNGQRYTPEHPPHGRAPFFEQG